MRPIRSIFSGDLAVAAEEAASANNATADTARRKELCAMVFIFLFPPTLINQPRERSSRRRLAGAAERWVSRLRSAAERAPTATGPIFSVGLNGLSPAGPRRAPKPPSKRYGGASLRCALDDHPQPHD